MRTLVAAATDIGHVRERNEDRYLVMGPVVAVADGMGGHLGGEIAASLAVEVLERQTARGESSLADRAREANRVVFERSMLDRAVTGMGTTLTAAEIRQGRAFLAHVGDSRAYLFRGGALTRLTEDHTLVHRMVLEGQLSEEQAEIHPHRNILTRALGIDPTVEVDEIEVDLRPGDRLLLCSDGLTGMLPERRIAEILHEETDPRSAVDRLIAEANDAGGVDNITAVLVDVLEGEEGGDPPARAIGATEVDLVGDTALHALAPRERTPAGPRGPSRHAFPRRTAVGVGLVVGFLVIALVGVRLYLDSQWYVGVSDGRVAIFRGIPAEVAGFELHHPVLETEIPAEEVRRLALYRDLDAGITAADRAEAEAIVEQIRADLARLRSPEVP